jgi:hypothetical protein
MLVITIRRIVGICGEPLQSFVGRFGLIAHCGSGVTYVGQYFAQSMQRGLSSTGRIKPKGI